MKKQKHRLKHNKNRTIIYNDYYHINKFQNWVENKGLYRLRQEYARRKYFGDFYYKEGDKVLEIGCGIGQNITWLPKGKKFAYDINHRLYPFLEEKGVHCFKSLKDVPDNSMEHVLLVMSLEHIPNPIELLKGDIKRILKPNGFLRIGLPSVSNSIGRRGGLNHSNDGHLWCWTPYEYNYLANFCGYTNLINKRLYLKGIERLYFLGFHKLGLYFPLLNLFGHLVGDYDFFYLSTPNENKELVDRVKKGQAYIEVVK